MNIVNSLWLWVMKTLKVWEKLVKLLVTLILLSGAVVASEKLPSEIINLDCWKITMPFNEQGRKAPKEILPPQILTYSIAENFFVNKKGNGVVFRAHCTSASTRNSSYPRCELRELNKDGTKASWSTDAGTHIMEVEQAITAVPPVKKHVVSAQIHDKKDDLIMIRLEGKKLFVERNKIGDVILDANYQLGTKFKLKIAAAEGHVKVWYNDELKMDWKVSAKGCYFKAGCYTQSNPSKGDKPESYGEVVIYKLKISHLE